MWVCVCVCVREREREGGEKERELYFYMHAQRCPLETVILKVKKLDLGEPRKILSYALEPPSAADIERAILNLKEVSLIIIC